MTITPEEVANVRESLQSCGENWRTHWLLKSANFIDDMAGLVMFGCLLMAYALLA